MTCVSCLCVGTYAATHGRWRSLCGSALHCWSVCVPATIELGKLLVFAQRSAFIGWSLESQAESVGLAPPHEAGCFLTAKLLLAADGVQLMRNWMHAIWQVLSGEAGCSPGMLEGLQTVTLLCCWLCGTPCSELHSRSQS